MTVLNALSFDVEDWFQVENLKEVISCDEWECCEPRVVENTRRVLRLLKRHQTHATFFILGWVAERCTGLVKEIASAGHEIASHGYGHELLYNLTPEEFRNDISKSKDILESISGYPVLGYRAPAFSVTSKSLWALDTLKDMGFHYDSSVFQTSFHNRYGFKGNVFRPFRFENGLVEIPLTIYRFCGVNFPMAGGGYFRLLPYACFRHLCRRLNSQGKPIVFYLHPWELDPEQPRVDCRLNYKIRHYVNLSKTESRLQKLLQEFNFVPFADLAEQYFPGTIHKT